jgi:predicted nucleic acid-binding protein
MRVVIGGKLLSELAQTKLRTLLLEWERGGRTHRLKDDEVERITQEFQSQTIESDDPHVLAVALLSGCRLIYTFDANLIKDFKNIRLLSPKGKVVTPTTSKRVADALFNEKGG